MKEKIKPKISQIDVILVTNFEVEKVIRVDEYNIYNFVFFITFRQNESYNSYILDFK